MSAASHTLGSETRAKVAKISVVQVSVIALISFSASFWDINVGVSFILGGLTCVLPNAYFSYRFFKHSGAQHSQLIVKNFYIGELVKIVLTIFMFIFSFKSGIAQPVPLFAGYGLALLLQWTAPFYVKNL